MQNKIKISQKDFDSMYQISDKKEITEETKSESSSADKDTTPEFLTEEEELSDKNMHDEFLDEEILL